MADIIDVRLPLDQIRAQLNELEKDFDQTLNKISGNAKKPGKDLGDGFDKSNPKIQNTKRSISGLDKQIQGLTGRVMRFAGAFTAAFTISNAVRNAANVITAYQDANAKLNATLSLTRDQTEQLRKQQIQLGSSTAFTAAQVTDAQLELGKLGQTLDQITATTPAVLDLAAATGVELADAARITAETLNQFSLSASEAQRVNDVMAKSFSSSALDINKFSTAMASAGPVAASAGVSLERTTALIGTLADRGLDASTAGTSLRNMFLVLSKEGLSFEDAMERVRTATDQNAAALELFGTRGATTAVILANNADAAERLEEKVSNAAGSLREMAEVQLDTLSGDLTKLSSAYEGFILSLEDGEGALSRFSRFTIQQLTTQLSILQDENLSTLQTFDLITRSLVNPVTGLNKYKEAVKAVSDEQQEFKDRIQNLRAAGDDAGLANLRQELIDLMETTEEGTRRFNMLRDTLLSLGEVDFAGQLKSINEELREQLGLTEQETVQQKGLLEVQRERLKLVKEQIQGATSQAEINRLVAEQEKIETRINIILNQRKLLNEGRVTDELLALEFGWTQTLQGMDAASAEFEQSVDDLFAGIIDGSNLAYAEAERQHRDWAGFVQQMNHDTNMAIVESALNVSQGLSDIFANDAQATKAFAIFQAVLNAYGSILNVLNSPVPVNPVARAALAASIGVQAFGQVARIRSTPVPSFYEGTEYLRRGKNPVGRDTIPVMAHEGEAIINAIQNRKAPGLAKAWNQGKLPEYIRVRHIEPALRQREAELELQKASMIATALGGVFKADLNDSRIVRQLKYGNLVAEEQAELLKKSMRRLNPYRA